MKESLEYDSYSKLLTIFETKILHGLSEKEKKEKEKIFRMAYKLAEIKFKGKVRDSGEPYFEHLVRTATIILNEFENPTFKKIILALLHDIYEDTTILEKTLKLAFKDSMFEMIKFISKNDNLLSGKNRNKLYFERLLKCTDETIIDVKLADRIDNLRTIGCWEKEKIIKKIAETRKYILPLANRFNKKAEKIILMEISKIEKELLFSGV